MEKIIEVSGLTKSYGALRVLDGLDFTVLSGEVFGLLGANGAGKSTTIECMLHTRQADSGAISILGMSPDRDRRKLFEQVGVQFQEVTYPDRIRVHELCEELACLYQKPADYRELIRQFGLAGKEKNLIIELSGGQKQRLFIILALIGSPKVVFLDELTTGLDAEARRMVWKTLKEWKQKGLTILLASHYMDEVEALCDRIAILRDGNFVFCGTVPEAVAQSGCEKLEDAYLWFTGKAAEFDV